MLQRVSLLFISRSGRSGNRETKEWQMLTELSRNKVGVRQGGQVAIWDRGHRFSVSIPWDIVNNVSTCCLHQKHSQILCLAMILLLNLDFSFSGTAAKKMHVLYTKIAGSYFNLWEQDGFPKTKCFIEHSVIKPLFYINLTNHNWVISWCVEFNLKVQAFFPPLAKRNHKLLLWRVAGNRLYENLFKPTEINNHFSLAN